MKEEELLNIIELNLNQQQGKYKGGNQVDRSIKNKVIDLIKQYAKQNNLQFKLDEDNDNDPFSRIDIVFSLNDKPYGIELKTRPSNNHLDYKDVMFEEDKLSYLKESLSALTTYFLCVWADDYFSLYDISKIDESMISHRQSFQTKTTQWNIHQHKQYLNKIFLPLESPSIIMKGNLNDYDTN